MPSRMCLVYEYVYLRKDRICFFLLRRTNGFVHQINPLHKKGVSSQAAKQKRIKVFLKCVFYFDVHVSYLSLSNSFIYMPFYIYHFNFYSKLLDNDAFQVKTSLQGTNNRFLGTNYLEQERCKLQCEFALFDFFLDTNKKQDMRNPHLRNEKRLEKRSQPNLLRIQITHKVHST